VGRGFVRRWEHGRLQNETAVGCYEYSRSRDCATPELSNADGPTDGQWPVFPTFDQRTLSALVRDGLDGPETINERRDGYARDFLLALDEDTHPPSITTDGVRSILKGPSETAEIEIEHPKHDYLAPYGGRRGMGELLVRGFGYTVAARYLDNSEKMVRDRYSHIEADELGVLATEATNEIDSSGANPVENFCMLR